jgi:hypothetical protein
MNAGR